MQNPFKLIVDSRHRESGSTSSTNFTVQLSTPIEDIVRVDLDYAIIPTTFYNITSSNNTITFVQSGSPSTTRTAILTVGSYTSTSLATEAKTQLDANGAGITYTITYSTTTFKFTITLSSGSVTLKWSIGGSPYLEFGFNATDTASLTSHVSTNAISLERPTICIISINEFDKTIYTSNNRNMVGSFWVKTLESSGTINDYDPPLNKILQLHSVPVIRELTIKLKDINDNVINLNGNDWIFSLILYNENYFRNRCNCCKRKRELKDFET